MVKSNINNYPIEVLQKSRTVLESNIRGVPGMFVSQENILRYQRQVREITKAIEYLELMEATKKRKREMALSK